MAYVDTSALEDEQQKNDPSGVVTGAGAPAAPAAPAGGGASGSSSTQSKTPANNFADLSQYLKINAPQEFGSTLAGKVGDDINSGETTLSDAQTQFKNRADASTIRDDQGLTNQLSQSPESVDPNAFATIRDAAYKGPTSLSDASDLNSQVTGAASSAVGKANASKTEGGRFALLDNYFGKPSYSSGQKSLDNLLVQDDPNSQQAFDQMRQNAQQLQSNVNQAGVDLGNYGAAAKGTTLSTRANARNALGIDDAGNYVDGLGALGSSVGQLNAQATARQKQAADEYAAATAATQGKTQLSQIDPALAQKYGITATSAGSISMPTFLRNPDFNYITDPQLGLNASGLWGVDPSKDITRVADSDLNAGAVATPAQATRLKALQNLGGLSTDLVSNLGASGTYDTEPVTAFNSADFANRESTSANLFNQQAASKAQDLQQQYQSGKLSKETATADWQSFLDTLRRQYGVSTS